MGADRALSVIALQGLLMGGVRNYGDHAALATQTPRILATAASLDYVLMLATDTAGTCIPLQDAQRSMREGLARAVDEALLVLRAIAQINDSAARDFAREGLRSVRATIAAEALADDERTFALIVLATDLSP